MSGELKKAIDALTAEIQKTNAGVQSMVEKLKKDDDKENGKGEGEGNGDANAPAAGEGKEPAGDAPDAGTGDGSGDAPAGDGDGDKKPEVEKANADRAALKTAVEAVNDLQKEVTTLKSSVETIGKGRPSATGLEREGDDAPSTLERDENGKLKRPSFEKWVG